MIQNPLVTIVTPSFNQAAFLEATLQSVLAQDFPLEYRVVDGGSTDGSLEILRRYSDRLDSWVSEPDGGQGEAINKGLRQARGEIVAWLNSDDLYLPGAIQAAVSALQADPNLGMVYANALSIDGQGRPTNLLAFEDWGLPELARFRIICQPAVFMRRSVLERAGYLDSSFHYMLDHHLWLKIARLAPIRHIPAVWSAARYHPEAKNVAHAPGFKREIFQILAWMQEQPEFQPLLEKEKMRIEAGAYRLAARYLLDGGLPGPSLRAYWKALYRDPAYALKHIHRMAYAAVCLVGGQPLANGLYRLRRRSPVDLSRLPDLSHWPGLKVSPGDGPISESRHP